MQFELPDLDGRRVLVTGATAGIGRAMAEALARAGAHTILLARDLERGEALRRELAAQARGPVDLVSCDLQSPLQVQRAGQALGERLDRLDVLIHNAGVYPQQRVLTSEGVELGLAVNVVAPWLLTGALLPLLPAGARVVQLAGVYYKRGELVLEDLHWSDRPFRPMQASAAQQLARVLLARAWARRLAERGVTVYAAHPGPVLTEAQRAAPWWTQALAHTLLRPGFVLPPEGARAVLRVALDPRLDAPSGSFFRRGRAEPLEGAALDDTLGERLWAAIEALRTHPTRQPPGMADW